MPTVATERNFTVSAVYNNLLQRSADNFKPGASRRCKGRASCSFVHVLLWVRECSLGLFVGLSCMRSYTSGLGGDDLERH
jgi:hypothetical protein